MRLLFGPKKYVFGVFLIILATDAASQAPLLKRSTLGSGGASVTVTAGGIAIAFPQSIGQVSVTGVFTGSDLELRQGFIQPVLILKSFPKSGEIPITAWPNPFSSEINIKLDKEMPGNIELNVVDLTGRVLFSENFPAEGAVRINLSSLVSGIYILQFRKENILFNYKIIKE